MMFAFIFLFSYRSQQVLYDLQHQEEYFQVLNHLFKSKEIFLKNSFLLTYDKQFVMNEDIQMLTQFHIYKTTMFSNRMFPFVAYTKIIHHQVYNPITYTKIDRNDVSNIIE